MQRIGFFLFFIIGALSAPAFASKAALCDNCPLSQARQLALTTAGSATRFGITVYIGDFNNSQLYKFFLLDSGNPLSPTGEPRDFGDLVEQAEDFPKILNQAIIHKGDTSRSGVTIAQLQPSVAEQRDFDELDWLVAYLDSRGIPTRDSIRAGGPPAIFDWNVPDGFGFDSAFDVMDFVGLQRQLGRVAIAASPFIADAVAALSFSTNIVDLKPFFNLEFSYKFHFSDGSTGLFVFDNQGELQGVSGSWRDSELNDIPQTAADVNGMSSFFGSGGGTNFNRTRDRVIQFAYSVSGGGGNGSSGCSFTCNEQSCTVTCRTN